MQKISGTTPKNLVIVNIAFGEEDQGLWQKVIIFYYIRFDTTDFLINMFMYYFSIKNEIKFSS